MRCEPNVSLLRGDGSSTGISELKNLNSFAAVAGGGGLRGEAPRGGALAPGGDGAAAGDLRVDDAGGPDHSSSGRRRRRPTTATSGSRTCPTCRRRRWRGSSPRGGRRLAAADAERSAAADRVKAEAGRLGLAADAADLLLVRGPDGGAVRGGPGGGGGGGAPAAEAGPALAGWFLGPLAGWVNGRGGDWGALRASAADLAAALGLLRSGKATAQVVKEHLLAGEWPGAGGDPAAFLAGKGVLGGAGEDAVRAACAEVVAANPERRGEDPGREDGGPRGARRAGDEEDAGDGGPGAVDRILRELAG